MVRAASRGRFIFILAGLFILVPLSLSYQFMVVSPYSVVNVFLLIAEVSIILLTFSSLKRGLFLLVFLVPLVNSINTMYHLPPLSIGQFLLLSLLIGYLFRCLLDRREYEAGLLPGSSGLKFLVAPMVLLAILITISFVATLLRYTNYYPVLWHSYTNLLVNSDGLTTTDALKDVIYRYSTYMSAFIVWFLVLRARLDRADFPRIMTVLALSTFVAMLLGIYQYVYNSGIGLDEFWRSSGRLNATLTDPNALGIFTCILFSILVGLMFMRFSPLMVLYGVILLLVVANMFFSGSRCALLGVGLTLVFMMLYGVSLSSVWRRVCRSFALFPRSYKSLVFVGLLCVVFVMINKADSLVKKLLLEARYDVNITMHLDTPAVRTYLKRNILISGWAFNQDSSEGTGIEKVVIKLDDLEGTILEEAHYGIDRPDVASFFSRPGYHSSGFHCYLDTSKVEAGKHTLYVIAHTTNGTYSCLSKEFVLDNSNGGTTDFSPTRIKGAPGMAGGLSEKRTIAGFDRFHSDFLTVLRVLLGYEHGLFGLLSSGRDLLWKQACTIITDYPLTGIGIGSFSHELPFYYDCSGIKDGVVDNTGNFYLQILVELGLPGLVLLLIVFYRLLFIMFRTISSRPGKFFFSGDRGLYIGLSASVVGMLIIFIFGPHTNFFEIQFVFWLILGLLTRFSVFYEQESCLPMQGTSSENRRWQDINIRRYLAGDIVFERFHNASSQSNHRLNLVGASPVRFLLVVGYCFYFFGSISMSMSQLSLFHKQNILGYDNSYGFYDEEVMADRSFRWIAREASLPVFIKGPELVIPIHAAHPDIVERPVEVNIFFNYNRVRRVILIDHEWQELRIPVFVKLGKRLTITVSVDRTWCPARNGESDDNRELGIAVGTISSSSVLLFGHSNKCFASIAASNPVPLGENKSTCRWYALHRNIWFESEVSPEDAMRRTFTHEFYHSCQAAYDWNTDLGFTENCAMNMEENVYNDINGYYTPG